jgi:polysaccharide biosynthesis/export protein
MKFMKAFAYIGIIALLLGASSCSLYKRTTYLQTTGKQEKDSLYKLQPAAYKLHPADLLYITVKSLDPQIDNLFSNVPGNVNTMSSFGSGNSMLYIRSYSVNADGNVILPVIGTVRMDGLNLTEARKALQQKADSMLNNAVVDLRLVSYKVSILGEVKIPGQYTVYNDKANLLEVLAMAGDITYYGNRKKVLLLRPTNEGTLTYQLDLTKRDFLSNDKFLIQPNDMIYVEPQRATAFRIQASDYTFFLSVLTSSLTAVLLVTNLLK